jgi:LysM repeat protein
MAVGVEVLAVRRTTLPVPQQRSKTFAMTIAPESGGTILKIPYAPKKVDHDNLGATYSAVNRPGLVEFFVFSKPDKPTMSMTLFIADKKVVASTGTSSTTTAIAVIKALQTFARKAARVRVAYGTLESGLWFITKMSLSSEERSPITDEITQATVQLDFARADSSLSGTGSGPVTGGVSTRPAPVQAPVAGVKPSTPSKAPSAPSARTYTTKKGDTLWGISIKFYGTGTKWRQIADANKIKDPRKLGYPKKLRIP